MNRKILEKLICYAYAKPELKAFGRYKKVFFKEINNKTYVILKYKHEMFQKSPLPSTEKYNELKNKINNSIKQGAKTPKYYGNHYYNNEYLEIQALAPGEPIKVFFKTNNASDIATQHFSQLIKTLKILDTNGIDIDYHNPHNFLYDEREGFSVVDLELKTNNNSSEQNIIDYIINSFIKITLPTLKLPKKESSLFERSLLHSKSLVSLI